jgi:hypothetical protein
LGIGPQIYAQPGKDLVLIRAAAVLDAILLNFENYPLG